MPNYVIVGVLGGGLLVGIVLYNRLVRARNLVAEGWSGIDVQLKRRLNLVPGLVECVRAYAQHESAALTSATRLRAGAGDDSASSDRLSGENELTGHLRTLLAVVERYPDLKANQGFLDLQKQLVEIEDQIQCARRYYNGAVRDYNVRVESFPGMLIAKPFRFKPAAFFEIEVASERAAPSAAMGSADQPAR